jgi:hypothetical protein
VRGALVIVWLVVAFAQDAPDAEEEAVSEEVIVYGELRVDQARDQVIEELGHLGYDKRIEKDGAIVMRHSSAWKGDVWLHEDGWMRIKRQPVRMEAPATPFGKTNSAGAWLGCVLYPFLCVKTGGQMVGKRKFQAVETRTASAVDPSVRDWGDRIADLAVDRKSEALPDRLEALWTQGTPLEDGVPNLGSIAERKAALLRFWETRTDTLWGERVRKIVESFIRGEVQSSETPFTDEEIARFNRRSRAGRELSLERRRMRVE